ncbi:TPA: N(4)-acetylcytidine aminohydrolase [Klebsiella pneumoniae]|nr:ASCH domain-containing protein [Klebsiella pneumoniae]
MQANDITFFQRFQDDILAGRKTITIRDAAESHFKPGDVLRVGRYEDDGYFCTIAVTATATATSTVTLDTLTEQHAQQENMTLGQLRQVISDIYPGESQFYVIEFKTL